MAANEKYLTYTDLKSNLQSKITKLGLNANIGYIPISDYDTFLTVLNSDGTYAATGMTTLEGYETHIGFGSLGKQVIHGANNWYPAMIAGRQYSNMSSGNVLPVYYSQYALINPGAGKFKAKDFILKVNGVDVSLAEVIRNYINS